MTNKIAIIIPYRNRVEHLSKMLPHTVSYFRRVTQIEPLFVLAEQLDNEKFNRGALLNQAYGCCKDLVDYVCFHDVDYMPMWADYSDCSLPTRIIWYGMDRQPVSDNSNLVITAQKTGLAAVSVMKKIHFEAANGYSNHYWGWGYEDTDLAMRLKAAGIPIAYKNGTFIPLKHNSNGFNMDGSPTESSMLNKQRFQLQKHPNHEDGLNSLNAKIISTEMAEIKGFQDHERAQLLHCKFDLKNIKS